MLTPLDLLYITLAIAVALVTIFLCITLVYLILILRDTNKAISAAKDTAEKINSYVMKPINALRSVGQHIGPIMEIIERKLTERTEITKETTKKKK